MAKPILLWGFLTIIIVFWALKPYSNYLGPYSKFFFGLSGSGFFGFEGGFGCVGFWG